MDKLQLLIVEDEESDLEACRDTIERYQTQQQCRIEVTECCDLENVKEAFGRLENCFDGAIIDLTLGGNNSGGNQVVRQIKESYFRIPTFILTGTPGDVDPSDAYIEVLKKGEVEYAELLDRFRKIYRTGLTRIMGGRGIIEQNLYEVFRNNLLPQRSKWEEYGEKDSSRTEKALLRHTLNHLLQLLDDDGEKCFPEEVYLHPPLTDAIRTGSIVRQKDSGSWFVVMNPACDLVIRDDSECNTDKVLLVEIDLHSVVLKDYPDTNLSNSKRDKWQRAFKNNKASYYHWLPQTSFFVGGFLNFRKLTSLSGEKFHVQFEKPKTHISLPFVKNIIARFSAYYARQGQPDIDFEQFVCLSEDKAANFS